MRELDYTKVGMRIRQIRRAKGWSQEKLAKKCGISMSFLGHIERGSRIMSLETFAGICSALGTGADELLWGVADASDSLHEMWNLSDRNLKAHAQEKADKKQGSRQADSYARYVRIMKSVAEIMNEA